MGAGNEHWSFAGRVAFVTGAASGIGRAAALAFARACAGDGDRGRDSAAVLGLCADAATFALGHAMVVDGGQTT